MTTTEVSGITFNSAISGGNVTYDGGSAIISRGACWSINSNPTISDSFTNDGTGAGNFSSTIIGLSPNTTYNIRAYATNIIGTAYGQQVSFTTQNSIFANIEFVPVQGSTFQMGSNTGYDDVRPIHSVTLSSFYISKYEITQTQWEQIMGSNPSYFVGSTRPVESVTWYQVQEFLSKLKQQTGKDFRLPTEAEYEFAARGGTNSKGYIYSGSNIVGDVAWYGEGDGGQTHPVGQKLPNELGIYDMSGNIWEWCLDWYGDYQSEAQIDPKGPTSGTWKVVRGCSYYDHDYLCAVTFRNAYYPTYLNRDTGFRVVLNL